MPASSTEHAQDPRAAQAIPNAEQQQFLRHFIRCMKRKILEKKYRKVNSSDEEPLLDLVHGFPRRGKSLLIAWMRRLMEKVRVGNTVFNLFVWLFRAPWLQQSAVSQYVTGAAFLPEALMATHVEINTSNQ